MRADDRPRSREIQGELHRAVPGLLTALAERKLELSQLTTHSATLEDVFVALTGRQLRDE